MPHSRTRHLEALLNKTLRFSPIVGIFGHRQVGKTTLAAKLARRFFTLDERETARAVEGDPARFLETHAAHPLVIDECQLSPPLFPAMKEWVRKNPRPGQLLLTGSVRFASRAAIRESLTGRLVSWELLPMDLSEILGRSLPETLPRLLKNTGVDVDLPKAPRVRDSHLSDYLVRGGLPGVFAVRDLAVREQRFETQLETILERDLRLLVQSTLSYRSLRNLLRELALQQGMPLDITDLSRRTRVSAPTLRKLLRTFESLFLIRILDTEGTERKPVVFLEDQGEATYLTEGANSALTDLTRLLYANIRHQAIYRPERKIRFFQYRNRGGATIPLCARGPEGTVGFIPTLDENPSSHALSSTRSFLARYKNAKILFFHRGSGDRVINRQVRAIGLGQLL